MKKKKKKCMPLHDDSQDMTLSLLECCSWWSTELPSGPSKQCAWWWCGQGRRAARIISASERPNLFSTTSDHAAHDLCTGEERSERLLPLRE